MSFRPLIDDLFGTTEARILWGVGGLVSAILIALLAILWPRAGQYVPPPTITVTPSPERRIVLEEGGVIDTGPTPTRLRPTATPGPTLTPTRTPTPNPTVAAATRQLMDLLTGTDADPFARLLLIPVGAPEHTVRYRSEDAINGASTHKVAILLYALFRDPEVALRGWSSDLRGMIVFSNNGDTARVLVEATQPGQETVAAFNRFLWDVLLLPETVGLTEWNYGPTDGQTARVPGYNPAPEVDGNPLTLAALLEVYRLLETPADFEAAADRAYARGYPAPGQYPTVNAYRGAVTLAADRARELLAEPYPDNPTPLEEALDRARVAHPDLDLTLYGKDGRLGPTDWLGGHWHLVEAGALTIYDGRSVQDCLIAYSVSSLQPADLLDAAVETCIVAAAAAPPR